MQIENQVQPSDPEHIKQMMEPGPGGPIFMINLLKFKDKAEYDDGRATDLSGRDAYMLYGNAVSRIIEHFGGRVVFMADVTFLSLGKMDELWDEVAIATYPERGDMVRMSMSPEWQAAAVHRTAGLKGQLNIETVIPDFAKESPWAKALLG
ncbi:MAG: DUF1330 domain-containing protein [Sphingomonadaceae bacterium]|nr:DUF1330 domain-containing protein [Sphingomonadaceae bacterium]